MADAALQISEPLDRLLEGPIAAPERINLPYATLPSNPARWAASRLTGPTAEYAKWSKAMWAIVESTRKAKITGKSARLLWSRTDARLKPILAHIEKRIADDEAETEALLSRIPLPVPIAYIRAYSRAVRQFFVTEHEDITDLYYAFMAVLAEGDEDAKPVGETLSTDDDIDAFMARITPA
jgi:hypothetical protein